MKILALETGGVRASIAAVEIAANEARVVAAAAFDEPRALSRDLIFHLDAILQAADWPRSELDALAVGLGPGSWTSLRVGLTTAKTLAQVWEVPLLGVASFDALASAVWRHFEQTGEDEFLLLTAAPCRPGAFYGKIFEVGENSIAPCQAEWIGDAQTLLDAAFSQALADEIEAPLVLAGDAAAGLAQLLEARGEAFVLLEIEAEAVAVEVAIAGAGLLAAGEAGDPFALLPLYLAPSNAERNRAAGL